MKEGLLSSDTSVLKRATWRNIPEDAILHSNRRANLFRPSKFFKTASVHLIGNDSNKSKFIPAERKSAESGESDAYKVKELHKPFTFEQKKLSGF
jgi:hypothetical protein